MTDPWSQARTIYHAVRMIQERVQRQHSLKERLLHGEGTCPELTFPQFNAVNAVRERGTVTIKELSEALQVSAPSASTMVDRLVDMGILTREQSQVDRREVAVSVSTRGLEALGALEEQILQIIVDLLGKLGPDAAAQWTGVYQKIEQIIVAEQHDTVRN